MKYVTRRSVVGLGATALLTGMAGRAKAIGKYAPGVSDAEIKLGTTAYYSGPASTAAAYGLAQVAYWSGQQRPCERDQIFASTAVADTNKRLENRSHWLSLDFL